MTADGCSLSMPPAIHRCSISFTILFIIAYHSVYILQPSPPIKRLICPQIPNFYFLCCYMRTVIGITAFSGSELEHLCTLLDAGRLRGKNLKKIWDFFTPILSHADYNTEYHTQRLTSYPLVDLLMKKT